MQKEKKYVFSNSQDLVISSYLTKIIRIGNSLGITLPKDIVKEGDFEAGDKVVVKLIKKIDYSYKCGVCGYYFNSEENFPECPACGEAHYFLEVKDG